MPEPTPPDADELAEYLVAGGASEKRAPEMADAILDEDVDRVVALLEADLADLDAKVDQLAEKIEGLEKQLSPGQATEIHSVIENLRSHREAAQAEIDKVRELDGGELTEWCAPGEEP